MNPFFTAPRFVLFAAFPLTLAAGEALAAESASTIALPTSYATGLIFAGLLFAAVFAFLWLRSRQRLKQNEQQVANLSNILDTIDVYIYQKDLQGHYTYVNRKQADLLELEKHQVLGKDDSDFFDSSLAEVIKTTDREVISHGQVFTREEQTVLRHNGKTQTCLSTKSPMLDDKGQVSGILGVSTDITARSAIERREQATNRILRVLASEPSVSVVLGQLVDFLQQHLSEVDVALLQRHGQDTAYRLEACSGISDSLQSSLTALDMSFEACCSSSGDPRVQVIDNFNEQLLSPGLGETVHASGYSSFWSIEVTSRDHQHLGLLMLFLGNKRAPAEDEVDFIERMAGFAGLAIERSKTIDMVFAQKDLLNKAIDEFPDAFLMKNYQGKYILANRAIADLYQTTPAEMIGKDDFDFTGNREQADSIRDNVREIMDRMETEIVYEESTDVASGETRYFKSVKKPLLNENAERQILVIAQDITEIERAKAQLEESNKQLNYVLNATVDAVWDWNREDNLIRHNERWNKITGFPDGARFHEVAEFIDLIHEADRARVEEATLLSRQPEQEYNIEYRLKTRDGRVIWVEDYGEAVEWDDQGEPTRVVGSMADITARKEDEQKIKYNEELLRSSINSFDASFTIYDPDNRLVIWNDHYLEHKTNQGIPIEAGMTMREILEKTVDKGLFQEAIGNEQEWIEKRLEIHSRPSSRTLLHSPGGDWFEIRTARTEDDYLIVGMIEITEFVNARQRADIANEAKSRFLATMSHELRTPMNGVLGMLELLSDTTLSDEQRKYVDNINQSGQSLLGIINDVLDHSKLDSHMVTLESIQFSLSDLLQDCLYATTGLANQKSLALTLDYPTSLESDFLGDPARLRQVVMNLLSNAIKFTERGGVEIAISNPGREDNVNEMDIVIRDTGIGIPDDAMGHLFDEFAQADQATTREFGGTGLGLAIVRQLVELMGGRITVESELGKGSAFTVRLPLKLAGDQDQVDLAVTETAIEQSGKQFDIKVLVVEDVPINRMVAEKFLKALGCRVDIAENGEQAVHSVKENHYDMIFMDCRMPVMDGYQATRVIRQLEPQSARIPIVALTANSSDEDWQACRESGMDAMITKPFRKRDLQNALSQWL